MDLPEQELTEYYLGVNRGSRVVLHSAEALAGMVQRGFMPHSVILGTGETARSMEPLVSSLGLSVPVYRAPEEKVADFLSEKAGVRIKPYPLIASFEVPVLPFSEETLLSFRRVVILNNLLYVKNIARIIDICICFGADALFFIETARSPFLSKISLLTDFRNLEIPIGMLPEDPEKYIGPFRSCGYTVIGTALRRESLDPRDLRKFSGSRTALMFGNEPNGLRDEDIDACDHVVKIPMAEGIDSLNVAESCAIALYELKVGDLSGKELQ